MNQQAKTIPFSLVKRKRKPVNLDGVKYFTAKEIKLLRKTARADAELSLQKNQVTGIRNWMAIDILTCTGLRVSECANLLCGDLHLSYGKSEIFVSNGKANVSGTVQIPLGLKKHIKAFLRWKELKREGIAPDDPLFVGQRGKWTCRAIQELVKGYLRKLNLYERGKSVHAIRHSYAVHLYSKERCLRTVQRQLRHISIQSTIVYADVLPEEIQEQVKGLWN